MMVPRLEEGSRLRLFPLWIGAFGDDQYRVVRRGGIREIATKEIGVQAIRLLEGGLSIGEVKSTLATRYKTLQQRVNLDPLLTSLANAGLIRSVGGHSLHLPAVGFRNQFIFLLRFTIVPALMKLIRNYCSIRVASRILRPLLSAEQKSGLRRQVAAAGSNFAYVVGSDKPSQVKEFKKRYYSNLIDNIADMECMWKRNPIKVGSWLRSRVRLQGEEYLQEAISLGRGVIVCGFHFSVVFMLPMCLMKSGYTITTMGAVPMNWGAQRTSRWWNEISESNENFGRIHYSPNMDIRSIQKLITVLRSGGTVLSYPDIFSLPTHSNAATASRAAYFGAVRSAMPRSTLRVPLMGKSVQMIEWTGWLSASTGSVVVPAATIRNADGSLTCEVEKAITYKVGDFEDKASFIDAMNRAVFSALDKRIRASPTQWFGWHNLHKMGLD